MALTALALFVRHGSSLAVVPGLTADPARPWAWRASVPLAHPGPDGLARHVPEIERLAVVGRAIVAAVPGGVLAAATTAAGVRSWLVYGDTDQRPATFPVEQFAITADPTWAEYAALCPTPAEQADVARRQAESTAVAAARSATHAAVQQLLRGGVDLSRPAPVRYQLDVRADAAVLRRASAEGLRVEAGSPVGLVRDDLPDLALILRTERWLIHDAGRDGGRYLGWAPVAA